jgi:glycosyltransferase involved in cell wall biosynthesis
MRHLGDIGGKGSCRSTIIVPAYNEEHRIGPTLYRYLNYFDEETEVMVVLNGCRDRTLEVVCGYMQERPNLRVIDEPGVVGKGGAITLGFSRARGDVVAYTDADGATSPEELDWLINSIGNHGGIIGSRWIDKELVRRRQTLFRRIASRLFNMMVRIMFNLPYHDTQCGAKAFKREAVEAIVDDLGTTNLAFDVDVLYLMRKNGYVLREVPTAWDDRPGSKIKMRREAPRMLKALIRMRIKHSRFKDLVK